MKTNFRRKVAMVVFAFCVGYGAYLKQRSSEISSLMVENIEALAGGEGDSAGCCPHVGSTCFSGGIILVDYEFCDF